MATKDFSKMTNKKLNALLASASEEDKVKIQEVLDARNQIAAEPEVESELTAEEQAIIDEAEKNGGINPMYQGKKAAKPKKNKLSDEERAALAAELKEKHLHHKCQVVLFGTIIWADGYICGVLDEKRSGTVLYRVKLDEGRTVHKAYDSELIKIFDEKIEVTEAKAKARNLSREARGKIDRSQPWSEEAVQQALEDTFPLLGRAVEIKKEEGENLAGRIIGLVPEKRAHVMLLRIKIDVAEGEAAKYMHKTVTAGDLAIAEEIDDKAKEIQDAYIARRAEKPAKEAKQKATPAERMIVLKDQLAKAEATATKAAERVQSLQEKIAACQAELDANLAEQAEETEELA